MKKTDEKDQHVWMPLYLGLEAHIVIRSIIFFAFDCKSFLLLFEISRETVEYSRIFSTNSC